MGTELPSFLSIVDAFYLRAYTRHFGFPFPVVYILLTVYCENC